MNSVEIKNGLVLGISATIAMLMIVIAYHLTRNTIRTTEQLELRSTLAKLLVPGSYDNEPATDIVRISNPALGSDEPMPVYRARTNGAPTGAVITSIAPDGYNGAIDLLVGLTYTGDVVAVRITGHNETPGLGDDIEESRSDWIHSFDNLTMSDMQPHEWTVKKDGGNFDQFTGATITPRAIVRSVHAVAQWYQAERKNIFIQATNESSSINDINAGNTLTK